MQYNRILYRSLYRLSQDSIGYLNHCLNKNKSIGYFTITLFIKQTTYKLPTKRVFGLEIVLFLFGGTGCGLEVEGPALFSILVESTRVILSWYTLFLVCAQFICLFFLSYNG
ncbi:hypothetical protein BD560DRAFT_409165 [Blakeslea trispora]|nr:hypothetical protein BD560DRAFT_409165 [Blakeslea trispora]